MSAEQYETVIGLEVHAQLLTKTKLFCNDATEFGLPPNTAVSVISLAHPGTLPKLNREAVELAIRLGLATSCNIVRENYFARKNYFYPDLPKGYQISQHTTPICINGKMTVETSVGRRDIRINRIHMEEDAGKSMHDTGEFSNIDFNRAGMPLVEIVTEPDIRSADEAADYLIRLRKLVRHLDVCDGNMEEGSFRCDVNISIRKKGDQQLGTKVEIKNLNSVRFMKKAIEYETVLMVSQIERGETIQQQTKGFDEKTGTTYTIRIKENEDDYRYFPEPDLPPFYVSEDWIEQVRQGMPESADELAEQLVEKYALTKNDVVFIAEDKGMLSFFESLFQATNNAKASANWINTPIRNFCLANDIAIESFPVNPASIARIILLIDKGNISYGMAVQQIFPALVENPLLDIQDIIQQQSLSIEGDEETEKYIDTALEKYADKISEYKKGKKGLMSLFVGEVMKLSRGKADAKKVTEKIKEKLQ